MAMDESALRAMLAAERADALAAVSATKLSQDRIDALDYYHGDMSAAMPAQPGRSSAVSTDVADTIDGLMPSLMEVFCAGDEVVRFAPVGPEDVAQAEQETDYVNHVFMQQNPGFMVLYTMIKDALLSKVGIVKVWTEEDEDVEEETYLDQPEDAFAFLSASGLEIVEHTEHEGLHDVKVAHRRKRKVHRVEPVPPEEFGIARNARCIKDAYCFHETQKTVADLIEQGYDEDQVNAVPSDGRLSDNTESTARDTVDEGDRDSGSDVMNKPMRLVTVTEHYIRMAYDGDDVCLYKVVTAGGNGEVLYRDGKPDVEKVDYVPFAGMTPVPNTHRFYGKSIADCVMDIQRIKTALMRGMLDNLYLHNNPRVEVSQAHATGDTLDDLLVSRPGGIVRSKQPGGIVWQVVPDITGSVYPALQYLDATREWRTGVTRQGQGIDANALQNQSATAVNQMMTAAQARMKMIARIFAETGIRDLFSLLHAEIRKHGDQADTVRLRNTWVPVDPRQWKTRKDLTIHVGLGSGNKQERVGNLMALISLQKEALVAGKTNLVSDDKLYNSAKELAKLMDYKDPEMFFNDPTAVDERGQPKHPAPEPPPSPEMMKVQVEAQKAQSDTQMKAAELQQRGQEIQAKAQLDQMADQRKAEIEQVQAQADMATQERKTQADMMLAQQRFELEKELKLLDYQLKREQQAADMEMRRELHQHQVANAQFGMAASAQKHEMSMKEKSPE